MRPSNAHSASCDPFCLLSDSRQSFPAGRRCFPHPPVTRRQLKRVARERFLSMLIQPRFKVSRTNLSATTSSPSLSHATNPPPPPPKHNNGLHLPPFHLPSQHPRCVSRMSGFSNLTPLTHVGHEPDPSDPRYCAICHYRIQ
jgi:hypothetical protein